MTWNGIVGWFCFCLLIFFQWAGGWKKGVREKHHVFFVGGGGANENNEMTFGYFLDESWF